jgi:hypothetical protein
VDVDFTPGSGTAPITVVANTAKTGASIVVGPRPLLAPNLAAFAYGSVENGPFTDPAQLPRSRPSRLLLGEGLNLVLGGVLLPGLSVAIQNGGNGGVTLGAPSFFSGLLMPVTVSAGAPLGPRLVVASTPNGVATFAGAMSVVAAYPAPDVDGDGTTDAADSCPAAWNRDQADRGGIGAGSAPDGIGDACQCGDVNGDGVVPVADAVLVTRSLLTPPAATLPFPALCDVGAGAGCNVADALVIRRALLSPPSESVEQSCAPALP